MATCRTCAYLRKCIEKATKEGYEHNVDFDASSGCPNFGFKSNTNADRIRAMSDEELADTRIRYDPTRDMYISDRGAHYDFVSAMEEELEWLKQPVEE